MKKITIFFVLLSFMVSCTTENLNEPIPDDVLFEKEKTDEKEEDLERMMVLGKALPNPYNVNVMYKAWEQIVKKIPGGEKMKIETTDLYIRILPKDEDQLEMLKNKFEMELFDFPLHHMIEKNGLYYRDPSLPEEQITWQYTTIKADVKLPSDIKYEVIDKCFIPHVEEGIKDEDPTSIFIGELEQLAYEIVGIRHLFPEEDPETRALIKSYYPEGVIRVRDDEKGIWDGVKRVKIRCHTVVKWATCYTGPDGWYRMNTKFSIGPHYAIVFENEKGFNIYGNWGPLAKANYNMGWHNKKGHNRDIGTNSSGWPYCAVNNAGYDYYKYCENKGIRKPPANLNVWVLKRIEDKSAAPMLSKVPASYDLRRADKMNNFFMALFVNIPVNILTSLLNGFLPDITLSTKGYGSRQIYELVHHEMHHASHYALAGNQYWSDYIHHIIAYRGYGTGAGVNAGVCAVGEMWGFSMARIARYEKYHNSVAGTGATYYFGYWFKPEVMYELYTSGHFSRREIFECLTSDVRTVPGLKNKMKSRYPGKQATIDMVFKKYGF